MWDRYDFDENQCRPKLKEETPPTEPLISVTDAKDYLRAYDDNDDTLIASMISAATARVQAFTRRKLLPQEWSVYWDVIPPFRRIEIPLAPLIQIETVEYVNAAGTYVALDASTYEIDNKSLVPAIVLYTSPPVRAPVFASYLNTFHVKVKVGYADAGKVPEALKMAVRRMIATWYDNRSDVSIGLEPWPTPDTAELLMYPFRIFSF